jgi:hypothetical protein
MFCMLLSMTTQFDLMNRLTNDSIAGSVFGEKKLREY